MQAGQINFSVSLKFTIANKCQTYVPGNVLIEGQCKPSQKTHRSS